MGSVEPNTQPTMALTPVAGLRHRPGDPGRSAAGLSPPFEDTPGAGVLCAFVG